MTGVDRVGVVGGSDLSVLPETDYVERGVQVETPVLSRVNSPSPTPPFYWCVCFYCY